MIESKLIPLFQSLLELEKRNEKLYGVRMRHKGNCVCLLVLTSSCLLVSGYLVQAATFRKPEEALKMIFQESKIEIKNVVLTPEQVTVIEKLSGIKQKERLVSFYEAKRGNEIAGYGFIDVHILRTKPTTILYVISHDGKIDMIEILSFHEPLEYLPHENWLNLFKGKSIDKDLIRHRRDIDSITGATITAKTITDNTRKVLAIWKVIFGGKR